MPACFLEHRQILDDVLRLVYTLNVNEIFLTYDRN